MMNSGMLGDVGGMIGADALIGFILHIIISAVIGALYTGLFMQLRRSGKSAVQYRGGRLDLWRHLVDHRRLDRYAGHFRAESFCRSI